MDIEQYLASDAAVEHLTCHLSLPYEDHKMQGGGDWVVTDAGEGLGPPWAGRNDGWQMRPLGRWTQVCYQSALRSAYFRTDGKDAATLQDRFIVTDLGEAVRALRLRTGQVSPPGAGKISNVLGSRLMMSGDALFIESVSTADLPRTICAVMLASYRVTR